MPRPPRRVWPFLVACTAILTAGACHHAPPPAPQPKVAEPSGRPSQSTDEGVVRRFPGVDIVPTNRSAFVIRIHSGMFEGEPLYVIDGAPMTIPANRGIDWFKPDDILDIKVLKYPHELMEYGAKGANGVIVISTKLAPGRSRKR